jgi:hypothetical protein
MINILQKEELVIKEIYAFKCTPYYGADQNDLSDPFFYIDVYTSDDLLNKNMDYHLIFEIDLSLASNGYQATQQVKCQYIIQNLNVNSSDIIFHLSRLLIQAETSATDYFYSKIPVECPLRNLTFKWHTFKEAQEIIQASEGLRNFEGQLLY